MADHMKLPPLEPRRNTYNVFDDAETIQQNELISLKPQIATLENQCQPQQARGDLKPEVYFIGQILGGINFGQCSSDGLFCELSVESSYHWQLLCPSKSIQTQTAYASNGHMNVWSHPLELAFSSTHFSNWPKGILKVWRLDQNNKIDIYSYGIFNFPKSQGHSRIECPTWSPIGQYDQQDIFNSLAFFMGNNPRLNQVDVVPNDQDQRRNIKSVSNGTVILEIDTLFKNYHVFGLTGQ